MADDVLKALREELAQAAYGRSLNDPGCVACGSSKMASGDFRDDISRAEARITKMCQGCQDEFFNVCKRCDGEGTSGGGTCPVCAGTGKP